MGKEMMAKSVKILNWVIGTYVVVDMFGYHAITKAEPSLRVLFVLAPIALIVWQLLILCCRFQLQRNATAASARRVQGDDWLRVFWILWAGHTPFASEYLWGFYLFSCLTLFLLLALTVTLSVEFYRRKTATPLVVGCLVFVYCLLSWEKNTYVIHYGVPIIGHFLEKPEYDTKYAVEISPRDSDARFKAIADIHVESRTETDDYGEELITSTYRDVWIKRLYFADAGSVDILDQSEALHLGESTFVEDAHGRSWYVTLLREPIP